MNGIKKYLFRKKILYTVCFVILGMIDFVRHTQQEVWWGPMVNCTGILLLIVILSQYNLRELWGNFSCIWSGGSMILSALSALWPADHILGIYKWTIFTAIINVWLIGILTYEVIKKIFFEKTLQVKWNIIGILAVVMVFFMMLSPYHAVWPIWFLAIFGLFYVTRFKKSDLRNLQDAMINGTIIVFFVLQIYAYGYRPFDVERYVGAFSNSNMAALHYLVTYAAILAKIHFLVINGSKKKWRYLFSIVAAIVLDFQILTMTRTAWVVSVVITALFGMIVVKRIWSQTWKTVLVRGAAFGVGVLILFPAVFVTVRWLPTLLCHPVWYEGEWKEEKVHSFDPPDSEKYTDFDEFMGDVLERLKIKAFINDPLVLKAQATELEEYRSLKLERPEDSASSLKIRLIIYKAYLEDLNWRGHKKIEGHYRIPETNAFVWHPQNVWIQIAYYYGIPAGILFLFLSMLILMEEIWNIIKDKENQYAFMPLFISIIFLMYGLTEIVWIIGQLILFLFLFMQHPQFRREVNGR